MLSNASKYPKKNLDFILTLQNSSQKKRLGFESDVYHFDTCPRLLGLRGPILRNPLFWDISCLVALSKVPT